MVGELADADTRAQLGSDTDDEPDLRLDIETLRRPEPRRGVAPVLTTGRTIGVPETTTDDERPW